MKWWNFKDEYEKEGLYFGGSKVVVKRSVIKKMRDVNEKKMKNVIENAKCGPMWEQKT